MYWSIHQYPSLADRSRAERQSIVNSALASYGGGYRRRFLVVLVALLIGAIVAGRTFAAGASVSDWRFWVAPAVGGELAHAYILWEINGSIHAAVKKYLAALKP